MQDSQDWTNGNNRHILELRPSIAKRNPDCPPRISAILAPPSRLVSPRNHHNKKAISIKPNPLQSQRRQSEKSSSATEIPEPVNLDLRNIRKKIFRPKLFQIHEIYRWAAVGATRRASTSRKPRPFLSIAIYDFLLAVLCFR